MREERAVALIRKYCSGQALSEQEIYDLLRGFGLGADLLLWANVALLVLVLAVFYGLWRADREYARYRNPADGAIRRIGSRDIAWCLGLGPFYFAWRRLWGQALVSLLLAVATLGASLLVYPFFTVSILKHWHEKRGWIRVEPQAESPSGGT